MAVVSTTFPLFTEPPAKYGWLGEFETVMQARDAVKGWHHDFREIS